MGRYTIPQEFNQSDRIGNFSMPQVFILGFSGTLIGLLIVTLNSIVATILLSIPILIATFLSLYIKINKIPIYEFLLIYALYIGTPKILIYRSDNTKNFDEFGNDGIVFVDKKKETKNTTKQKKSSIKEKSKSSNVKKKQPPQNRKSPNKKISNNNQKTNSGVVKKNRKGVKKK